jgi:DNA-binding CsgD family transcriptional regulator
VHVPTGPGTTALFGLFRGGGIFREQEKRLLELAQTHLFNAQRLALARTEADDVRLEPGLFVTAGFTPRESETLYWLIQGKTNQEIATLLKVRTDTVSAYLKNTYDKLGVENRVSAAVRALQLARKIDLAFRKDRAGVVTLSVPTIA